MDIFDFQRWDYWGVLAISAAIMATPFGCTSSHSAIQAIMDTNNLTSEETLVMNMPESPVTLDWQISTDTAASMIEGNIMQGLTEFAEEGPEIRLVPGLASQWDMEAENSKFTFK